MAGTLYIVGTPIGNLGDFSPRAIQTLSAVDLIACEDTRVTAKLLNHFGITAKCESYHKFNEKQKGGMILGKLQEGLSVALCTDAGMPAISDPGHELVALCHQNGIKVECVPGPTALTSAAALSLVSTARFCFEGFLSTAPKSRKEHLNEVKTHKETLIFYEAPHKLRATLEDMLKVFGDRNISVVKEITKIHETVLNTTILGAVEYFKEHDPKGEYVLIIEGAKENDTEKATLQDAVNMAKELKSGGMSATEAAKTAAAKTGYKKSDIYKEIV